MMQGSLAERLRVLRAREGLTLMEASERIGITRHTLRSLELGGQEPHYPTLNKIAAGYGVAVEELIEEPVQEPELAGKAEAPHGTGRSEPRTYREVVEELEDIRESFHTERDAFDGYISRWEQWLREGHPSEEQVREFLLTSESYYLALTGLARDELWAITVALGVELGAEPMETIPDELKRESSLIPLIDRFVALADELGDAWAEREQADSEAPGSADVIHIGALRDKRLEVDLVPRASLPQKTG